MLYDKRWEKTEVAADPFKLGTLIAWLEKQPSKKEYEFTDCGRCALAQYFSAHGFGEINMGTADFGYGNDFENTRPLPAGWNNLVNPESHKSGWNTFGAILMRARALQKRDE